MIHDSFKFNMNFQEESDPSKMLVVRKSIFEKIGFSNGEI